MPYRYPAALGAYTILVCWYLWGFYAPLYSSLRLYGAATILTSAFCYMAFRRREVWAAPRVYIGLFIAGFAILPVLFILVKYTGVPDPRFIAMCPKAATQRPPTGADVRYAAALVGIALGPS